MRKLILSFSLLFCYSEAWLQKAGEAILLDTLNDHNIYSDSIYNCFIHSVSNSKAQNGKPLSKETKQKMRKSHIGKTHSEESKQKMRRPKTEEWKKNQSEAMKRKESLSKIRRIK